MVQSKGPEGETPKRSGRARQKHFFLPPNHPLPNGHLWDSMGIYGRQQTQVICCSLVTKSLLSVRRTVIFKDFQPAGARLAAFLSSRFHGASFKMLPASDLTLPVRSNGR